MNKEHVNGYQEGHNTIQQDWRAIAQRGDRSRRRQYCAHRSERERQSKACEGRDRDAEEGQGGARGQQESEVCHPREKATGETVGDQGREGESYQGSGGGDAEAGQGETYERT